MDCPLLECVDYGISLTRKRQEWNLQEEDPIVTQLMRGANDKKVYVFEGNNPDKQKGGVGIETVW